MAIYVDTRSGWQVVATGTDHTAVGGFITTSTGTLVIDYSPWYERIATALETVANLSTTTGVRTVGPYDWEQGISLYNWYMQQRNNLDSTLITSTHYTSVLAAANTITSVFPRFL
jgi:hypothetical protein